jgi:hypothetical protein
VQHRDRSNGGFVIVDLGVGHPRVIVDDGVHERVTQLGIVRTAAFDSLGVAPVLEALGASDEPPTPAIWDVA